MLDSLLTSLNVVLPICVMLICGAILKKRSFINAELISKINKLVFRLFLPVSLFKNCYTGNLDSNGNGKMIVFCCLIVLLVFLIYIPIAKKTDLDNSRRSVILQASFRGNLAMFGVPVLTLLYNGENLGVMAILLAFIIPELNVLAVLCFDIFSLRKADFKKVAIKIAKNPLIISIVLGVLLNILKIKLPGFINKSIDSISAVTTPLSFVMLGAGFSFKAAKSNVKALSVSLIGKLVVLPLVAMITGIALGLKGPVLASTITLFGAPVAVSSVPMADEMGGDTQLASEAVVISTVLAVITMFIWIFVMSYFKLL